MRSMGVKPGNQIECACKSGEQHRFEVRDDLSVDSSIAPPIHRLYLVKDYVNKVIEAGIYRLTLKRYELLQRLSAISTLVTSIWAILAVGTGLSLLTLPPGNLQ